MFKIYIFVGLSENEIQQFDTTWQVPAKKVLFELKIKPPTFIR